MGIVFEEFDSMDAFARSLSRSENKVFSGETLSSKKHGNEKWYGTPNFNTALDLFYNGWGEKADEIRKEFVKFERAQVRDVTYQKSRPTATVVGFAPHVPNAILGLPNSMIHTERTPMKAKVVRIIYNMAMNCNTDAKDIMNAGLTVLKIAYSLERKGFRVRIDVNPKMCRSSGETACALVCVKDWRQHIDIKKVAFPVAHPSMFRRLGFRWLESTPNLSVKGFTCGYGQSIEDENEAQKVLKTCGLLEDSDYFVNVRIAKNHGYDPAKVAEAIGIKNL